VGMVEMAQKTKKNPILLAYLHPIAPMPAI